MTIKNFSFYEKFIFIILSFITFYFTNTLSYTKFFPALVSFFVLYVISLFICEYFFCFNKKHAHRFILFTLIIIFINYRLDNSEYFLITVLIFFLFYFIRIFLKQYPHNVSKYFIFLLAYIGFFSVGYSIGGINFYDFIYTGTDFRHYHWQSNDFLNLTYSRPHYFYEGIGILVSPINFLLSQNVVKPLQVYEGTVALNDYLKFFNISFFWPLLVYFQTEALKKILSFHGIDLGINKIIILFIFFIFLFFYLYWNYVPSSFGDQFKPIFYICFGIVNGVEFYTFFILSFLFYSIFFNVNVVYLLFFCSTLLLIKETNILFFILYLLALFNKFLFFRKINFFNSVFCFIKEYFKLLTVPVFFFLLQLAFNIFQGGNIFGNRALQWTNVRAEKWSDYIYKNYGIFESYPYFRSFDYFIVNVKAFYDFYSFFWLIYFIVLIMYLKYTSFKYALISFFVLFFIFFVIFLNLHHMIYHSIWRYNFLILPFVYFTFIYWVVIVFRSKQ